jgi:CBS domain-containing protein
MQRGSDTHGPRLDDDLKREFESDERANRATRAHEWRDPEPSEAELAVPGDSERVEGGAVAAQTVGEVMTAGVVGVSLGSPVSEAAAQMRDFDVGDVLVMEND